MSISQEDRERFFEEEAGETRADMKGERGKSMSEHYEPSNPQEYPHELRSEVALMRQDNRRLKAFLHARTMHPDYEYETTDGPRKTWGEDADRPPEGDGWERNIHLGREGGPDAGWDRFDYHEESYWMRRIAGSGTTDEGRGT